MPIGGETFTPDLDVTVGDPTKEKNHDDLANNTDFLHEAGKVDHDWDETTGEGYHKATYNAAMTLKNGTNYGKVFIDFTDTAKPILRLKYGIGAVPTVNAATDGFVMAVDITGPAAPSGL